MRNFWISALLALSTCMGTAAAQPVTVEVGKRPVAIATPESTERVSVVSPMIFSIYQAALPTTHRLVEAFISPADLERTLAGQLAEDMVYQAQAMHSSEHLDITAADWREIRPELIRQMGSLDIGKLVSAQEGGASERLSEVSGVDIDVAFGEVGRAQVYGSDPRSVRFHVLMEVSAGNGTTQLAVQLQAAAAAVPLNGRLLFLYVLRQHHPGEDSSTVRAGLDRWVDATLAANTN